MDTSEQALFSRNALQELSKLFALFRIQRAADRIVVFAAYLADCCEDLAAVFRDAQGISAAVVSIGLTATRPCIAVRVPPHLLQLLNGPVRLSRRLLLLRLLFCHPS